MRTSAVEFTGMARRVQEATRALGLLVPAFRVSPGQEAPRVLRRFPAAVVVSVRLDRGPDAVGADLVDGVLAANRTAAADAPAVRAVLLDAVAA
jgi:hypothetical protein